MSYSKETNRKSDLQTSTTEIDERVGDDSGVRVQLRKAGLRVTAPRLAVLAAVAGEGQHRDADAIAVAARARLGTLSTQAVYDNLHALVEVGLVRRIQPAGSPARYEARVGDNHHHIVCRQCGVMRDTDCRMGIAPCLEPLTPHGYKIDEAEVIFWGYCPECQSRENQKFEIE